LKLRVDVRYGESHTFDITGTISFFYMTTRSCIRLIANEGDIPETMLIELTSDGC